MPEQVICFWLRSEIVRTMVSITKGVKSVSQSKCDADLKQHDPTLCYKREATELYTEKQPSYTLRC
ncbi:hypothetical protein DD238_007701 [Peronospora effusa]|uniref:Uncharacterized protein n=1 Tax=Peronospora effusa TaxID=542832 RepID=A0A3M6VB32_9STRA|nr:hypothetical protein DD238_007701 [Peronospora effusa]